MLDSLMLELSSSVLDDLSSHELSTVFGEVSTLLSSISGDTKLIRTYEKKETG